MMKYFLLSGVVASGLVASEKPVNYHLISGGTGYKRHWQEDYKFEAIGYNFSYKFESPKGYGFNTDFFTAGNSDEKLEVYSTTFYFKFPVDVNMTVIPFLSKEASHHMKSHDKNTLTNISIHSKYMGLRFEHIPYYNLSYGVETSVIGQYQNEIDYAHTHGFHGKVSPQPWGLKGKANFSTKWDNGISVDISAHYGQALKREYYDCGGDIKIQWEF